MKNLEDILWNDNMNNYDENSLNGIESEGELPRVLNFYCLEICCSSPPSCGLPVPVSTFGCK